MFEFVRRNLTQTLESSDFRVLTQFLNRIKTLFIRIAINGLLLISYTEKWSLQNIYMTTFHQIRVELKEESE